MVFLSDLKFSKTNCRSVLSLAIIACVAIGALSLVGPIQTLAQSVTTGGSGLPVPRFVSLKSQNVNMRVGPGKEYQVAWRYVKKGLPIEIIQEFENWRKVRDPEGSEGWILHSLLSGRRTVIVNPGEIDKASGVVSMFSQAGTQDKLVATLEAGVVAEVLSCEEEWCEISVDDVDGHVEKKKLWGVYPDELIEK